MIILIPLGGTGERFKNAGYKTPKAFIHIFGKPILYYLLDNISDAEKHLIYIPYNPEYKKFRFEDQLKKDYPSFNFIFLNLEQNTDGAAQTINIALSKLDLPDCPILCLDSDNFYTTNILTIWNGENKIITIKDYNETPIYSYIKSENTRIIDIVEKCKISNDACTGAYGFNSYKTLLQYTEKVIEKNIRQKNEYYTSTVISEMIKDGIQFHIFEINTNDWHCLGTPLQVKMFYNNMPKTSCINNRIVIEPKRYCFDLDNTLVTYPKIKNDYTTVEPIEENIEFLRYLKKFGNVIIIYTARRMKTHHGNVGKLLADIGKITFDTLAKFDIPFDEIYFGKPEADMYIDDKALSCFDNMEKEIGYYKDTILPRDFNILENNYIDTYTKRSTKLSGEIFYYNNIPNCIKDLFPILIDYDLTDNKWYTMEKIKGNTATSLYINELLTSDMLIHILNSINRIHCVNINTILHDVNIYDNYSRKFTDRYVGFDFSPYPDSALYFDKINAKLISYETAEKGRKCVIHGDTVLTNILINKYGKIKFIDMRGQIGDSLSLCGDYLYDWAKVYQSLIGYDCILLNKEVSLNYKNTLLVTFKSYFLQKFSEEELEYIHYITASLLFSLIPLHNNERCLKYYELIRKLVPI
jgi:capsule biosynthesis phosphatase